MPGSAVASASEVSRRARPEAQAAAGHPFNAMEEEGLTAHLNEMEVAAFIDRGLDPDGRARVARHLVGCDACRSEVVAISRFTRARNRPGWLPLIPLAAAAAALLLYLGPPPGQRRDAAEPPLFREPALTVAPAPTPIAPRGEIETIAAITWSTVPHADRYVVTVFDSTGSLVWRARTTDTLLAVPRSTATLLSRQMPYYWKVAARVDAGRWVNSDLVSFTLAHEPPPK